MLGDQRPTTRSQHKPQTSTGTPSRTKPTLSLHAVMLASRDWSTGRREVPSTTVQRVLREVSGANGSTTYHPRRHRPPPHSHSPTPSPSRPPQHHPQPQPAPSVPSPSPSVLTLTQHPPCPSHESVEQYRIAQLVRGGGEASSHAQQHSGYHIQTIRDQ